MIHVALHAPRIPQNAGQVARTCWAMNCPLHLIRPLGFRLEAAALRRAAVGYLEQVRPAVHADLDALRAAVPDPGRIWMASRHGHVAHERADFRPGDTLLLGNETEGLPREWLEARPDRSVVIEMPNPEARCLNLATAATVLIFEALRRAREAPGTPGPAAR